MLYHFISPGKGIYKARSHERDSVLNTMINGDPHGEDDI